jgi:hypothetical protein
VISSWNALPSALRELEIMGCGVTFPSGRHGQPRGFDRLDLGDMIASDLPAFPHGIQVKELRICRVSGLRSLNGFSPLEGVHTVVVQSCPDLKDVTTLDRWRDTRSITFDGCPAVRVRPLIFMPALQRAEFVGRPGTAFAIDLSSLADLSRPLQIVLSGFDTMDLTSLTDAPYVDIEVIGDGELTGAERLGGRLHRRSEAVAA